MTIANDLADKAVEEIPMLMDTAKPNIAERAIVPQSKSSPSLTRNVVIGGLLGLLAIAAILTVIFLMDDTMATAEDVQRKIGIMPLTVIPEGELQQRYSPDEDAGSASRRSRKKRHRSKKGGTDA